MSMCSFLWVAQLLDSTGMFSAPLHFILGVLSREMSYHLSVALTTSWAWGVLWWYSGVIQSSLIPFAGFHPSSFSLWNQGWQPSSSFAGSYRKDSLYNIKCLRNAETGTFCEDAKWKAISSHIRALCSLSGELPWPNTNTVSTCLMTLGSGCSSLAEEGRSRGADWDGVKPGPAGLRLHHVQDANDMQMTEGFENHCILLPVVSWCWRRTGILEWHTGWESVAGNIWKLRTAFELPNWRHWRANGESGSASHPATVQVCGVDAVMDHQNPSKCCTDRPCMHSMGCAREVQRTPWALHQET